MKIAISNPSLDDIERTYLAKSTQTGDTVLTVKNNDRFVTPAGVQLGRLGAERTEIVSFTSKATGTGLTVGATLFSHDADDPVYSLKYNQIKIYRSTTGIDGSYNALATVAIDVDNATLKTVYDDTAGLTSYYYKASYYDSINAVESDLTDPIAGSGYPRGTAGRIINETFTELGDSTQQNMSVSEAIALLNEVNDDVISQSRRPYRFLKTSALLNTTINTDRIKLPTNLAKFDRLLYTNAYDQRTDSYRRISMDEMEYINFDNTTDASTDLIYISIDESTNELVFFPKFGATTVGAIKVFYWKNFDEITSMASVVQTPNARIYKMFLMGRYYRKRAIKEPNYLTLSDRYLSDYNTEIVKLQRSNKLDMGTPMSWKPDTGHSRGLKRI